MRSNPDSSSASGIGALGGALAGAAMVALAWRIDAQWRRREKARLHRALVDLLLNALNAGDPVTERHSRRVADLAEVVFRKYGIGRSEHATVRLAALLHDMGKIDDRFFHILHSCDPLSPAEREQIEEHPIESADILEPLEPVHPGLSEIVQSHHECWDGGGYPRGLKEDEIPLGARIISVADVFDALTQPRSYRKPMSVEEALRELRRGAGSRFDPEVLDRVASPEVLREWETVVARGRAEETEASQAAATE